MQKWVHADVDGFPPRFLSVHMFVVKACHVLLVTSLQNLVFFFCDSTPAEQVLTENSMSLEKV